MVAYANHNHVYDGHLIWLAASTLFGRDVTIWMRELDRFPFFGLAGALPFPEDDPVRRAVSIRKTARRFASKTPPVLGYFPQGRLVAPDCSIDDFNVDIFRRLGRLMPRALWVPFGIHVTWWGEDCPTALLGAGEPHESVRGDEAERLREVVSRLKGCPEPTYHTLLEGSASMHERWNFSFARRLFLK